MCISDCGLIQGEPELIGQRGGPGQDIPELVELFLSGAFPNRPCEFS